MRGQCCDPTEPLIVSEMTVIAPRCLFHQLAFLRRIKPPCSGGIALRPRSTPPPCLGYKCTEVDRSPGGRRTRATWYGVLEVFGDMPDTREFCPDAAVALP